jgi:hypothetical protein
MNVSGFVDWFWNGSAVFYKYIDRIVRVSVSLNEHTLLIVDKMFSGSLLLKLRNITSHGVSFRPFSRFCCCNEKISAFEPRI